VSEAPVEHPVPPGLAGVAVSGIAVAPDALDPHIPVHQDRGELELSVRIWFALVGDPQAIRETCHNSAARRRRPVVPGAYTTVRRFRRAWLSARFRIDTAMASLAERRETPARVKTMVTQVTGFLARRLSMPWLSPARYLSINSRSLRRGMYREPIYNVP
jgi:hypothetical protein